MISEQRIEAIPFLAGLEKDVVQRLMLNAELRQHPKEHVLFKEGESSECLFVLTKGIVELYTRGPRRDAVILFMWPKDIFLPAAVLTGAPYLISGRTLGCAETLQFDVGKIKEELEHNAALAGRLLQTVSMQFRRTVRHLKDLKTRSGPQRVGAFLLRLVTETGRGGFADLPFPKSSIASRLGLTPESFSRALHEVAANGLTVRGTRVIVTDRAKIEAFCGFDPLIDRFDAPA